MMMKQSSQDLAGRPRSRPPLQSLPAQTGAVVPGDGFWLPAALRARVLADADWETAWLRGGALLEGPADDAVAVRWPRLTSGQWQALLAGLQDGRRVPAQEVAPRWEAALASVAAALTTDVGRLLPAVAAATGYSPAMLRVALGGGELLNAGWLAAATGFRPTWSLARRWEPLPGLPGRARFFPAARWPGAASRWRAAAPLSRPAPPVNLALGFAAGNVPGTALLIALLGALANQAAASGIPAPALLVRNSRHEPLFAPLVLQAIEAVDPELVAGVALLIWDYADEGLQADLMRRTGLLIAAAGDETIAALEAQRARHAPRCRFHAHGHKASFAVIEDATPELARLAALDSSLWDQNGCLSARVHFVAGDAGAYGRQLTAAMRDLAAQAPRGTTPRRFVHRAFDSYTSAADALGQDQVQVCSDYDDDFAVILDRRPWQGEVFHRVVNLCQGRVVIVRPVRDPLEAADTLRWLPAANLQSVSVALDEGRLVPFADAAGALGVTAIRKLGQAAFPKLAYSWDGLLPLDMGYLRPAGHFTTIEFDYML